MNLSRLAVLAVFFMMVMSTFVTVPTYNVAADNHEESENDDNGDECPFDMDNSENPCEAEECVDHESEECTNYVRGYCEDFEDSACEMVMDNDGEHDDGPDIEDFYLTATMDSLEDWSVEYHGAMPIGWSDNTRSDVVQMCEDMLGTDGNEINQECFDRWTEMFDDDNSGPDDCPFDRQNPDSPCNAEVCRNDDESEECEDYIESYCADSDDSMCDIWAGCSSDSSMKDCMTAIYNHCNSDDRSEDVCAGDFQQDDNGTWVQCWSNYDEETGEYCQPHWLFGLIAYEYGDITAEDFMDYYMVPTFAQADDHDDYKTALYELSHITLEEGTWVIVPDYLSSPNPNFICGNGERIYFSW